MTDPHDITNDVYSQRNDPWDTIDALFGKVRDFFAVIGIVATIGFLIGYHWIKV